MPESYDVRTIVGIAQLPEDAFGRFLKELPIMVDVVRANIEMVDGLRNLAGMDKATEAEMLETIEGLRWIDDDKGNVNINLDVQVDGGERQRVVTMAANYKTGTADIKLDASAMSAGTAETNEDSAQSRRDASAAPEGGDAQTQSAKSRGEQG